MPQFNLVVRFEGLFLFVPDPDRQLLHVLLPRTGFLGGDRHHPQWENLNSTQQPPEFEPFEDVYVDLSGVPAGGPLPSSLPSSVANIAPHNDCSVTADHVSRDLHPNMVAAICLSAPGDIAPGQATLWELAGRNMYLTNELECIWPDLALPSLNFTLVSRNGTSVSRELQPNGDGWMLKFKHLPEKDHPIGKGNPAHHFRAYYTVCGSNRPGPLPVLKQTPPEKAASTFTCMLGQAPLT
jgi:hypothetical protein